MARPSKTDCANATAWFAVAALTLWAAYLECANPSGEQPEAVTLGAFLFAMSFTGSALSWVFHFDSVAPTIQSCGAHASDYSCGRDYPLAHSSAAIAHVLATFAAWFVPLLLGKQTAKEFLADLG